MKERLVEDWLTRINERGYQAAFGQILSSRGFTILRLGHSPYEHGKDLLAISPNGEVHCFQLKDGNIGLKEFEKAFPQVTALMETLPSHPSLPANFHFRPFLVTNGLFSDPALSRIEAANRSWEQRKLPKLEVYDGRWIQSELLRLSTDFWPSTAPDVREFRTLYLVDGRGDFEASDFAKFLAKHLPDNLAEIEFERRVAAINLFASYVLGEFYAQQDHWSVFRGWMMTSARISAVSQRAGFFSPKIETSVNLAFDAALSALDSLAMECTKADSFSPDGIEWDEYTKVRNTVGVGGWAAWCLMKPTEDASGCIDKIKSFFSQDRISPWGESWFPYLCAMVWLLDREHQHEDAKLLLNYWKNLLVDRQQRDSDDPFDDVYVTPDEILVELVDTTNETRQKTPRSVSSYTILPLVLMLVNRKCREELTASWPDISNIAITTFRPGDSAGYLDWNCTSGAEHDQQFMQPQAWSELESMAASPSIYLLPRSLSENPSFRLAFLMAFPHRVQWSIIGSLDRNSLRLEILPQENESETAMVDAHQVSAPISSSTR